LKEPIAEVAEAAEVRREGNFFARRTSAASVTSAIGSSPKPGE